MALVRTLGGGFIFGGMLAILFEGAHENSLGRAKSEVLQASQSALVLRPAPSASSFTLTDQEKSQQEATKQRYCTPSRPRPVEENQF